MASPIAWPKVSSELSDMVEVAKVIPRKKMAGSRSNREEPRETYHFKVKGKESSTCGVAQLKATLASKSPFRSGNGKCYWIMMLIDIIIRSSVIDERRSTDE
jgi:hypothetical protein